MAGVMPAGGHRMYTIAIVKTNKDHPLHKYWNISFKKWPQLVGCRCDHVSHEDECPDLKKKWLIYEVLASGTFGIVYLARDQKNPNLHVVIKRIKPGFFDNSDIIEVFEYRSRPRIVTEAYLLAGLRGSPHINQIVGQYVHNEDIYIVMELFGLLITNEMREAPEIHHGTEPGEMEVSLGLSPPTGEDFIIDTTREKRSLLSENDVCKVVSHLLAGLLYAKGRGVIHSDICHRNYLVDKDLNAQLIDFGTSALCLEERDFERGYAFIQQVENVILPEAINPNNLEVRNGTKFDIREGDVWRLGVLTFELLGGCPPWQDQNEKDWQRYVVDQGWIYPEETKARRARILEFPVPVYERLSEDCKDALRAMLATNPAERVTLEELATLPWFSGWFVDSDHVFRKPDTSAEG